MRPAVLATSLAVLALSFAIPLLRSPSPPVDPAPAHATSPARPPTDYARAALRLDHQIAASRRHGERHPNDWAHLETLAGLHAARASLTGDHEDYLRAQAALERAFALAPDGGGPLLARAYLDFTLHRLPSATRALDRISQGAVMRAGEQHDLEALRADVAFHAGDYARALAGFRALHAADPHPGSAYRLALYAWKTGDFAEADRWLAAGERLIGTELAPGAAHPGSRLHAWFQLQRGLLDLDRGRLDQALAHYRRADALFSGWWLVEEHVAEVLALRGDTAAAEARYRSLIARTDNPEFMAALADLVEDRDPAEARTWRDHAAAHHARWLERLPEASYGHALAHMLEHGSPGRALDLAERNFGLRPGGAASILLAQALVRTGRCDDARARIEAVLATPYRTAALHATAASIFERCGDPARVPEQRALAVQIHPGAMAEVAFLARS